MIQGSRVVVQARYRKTVRPRSRTRDPHLPDLRAFYLDFYMTFLLIRLSLFHRSTEPVPKNLLHNTCQDGQRHL